MKYSTQNNLAAALIASCAFIGFAPAANADIQTIRSSDRAIWGSLGGDLYAYKETATPPNLPDSERGWLDSGAVGVNYLTNSNIYYAGEATYSWGDARYRGAYFLFPATPLDGRTNEKISTFDGKIGKAYAMGNSAMLIPYGELGYRYWDRDLTAGQKEDYQNYNAMAGLMLQYSPMQRLIFQAYGAAGVTLHAEMKTFGQTYPLGDSPVYGVGGKIGYNITQHVELFTSVDYDYFHYGQSNVYNGAYEPNSHTNETAVRVGLSYHFQ